MTDKPTCDQGRVRLAAQAVGRDLEHRRQEWIRARNARALAAGWVICATTTRTGAQCTQPCDQAGLPEPRCPWHGGPAWPGRPLPTAGRTRVVAIAPLDVAPSRPTVARPTGQTCDRIVAGGSTTCGSTSTRRYLVGWRCPDHTPAALDGRPEPGSTDQAEWLAAHPSRPRTQRAYGQTA